MPERLGFMMLSGCGYPHGTAGNRSEREKIHFKSLIWSGLLGRDSVE